MGWGIAVDRTRPGPDNGILGIGFPIMFASYHYLVRGTFIGAVLNGRRYPRTLSRSNEPTLSVRLEATV